MPLRKYLIPTINSTILYDNTLIQGEEKVGFLLRPQISENSFYLSYYINNIFLNVYVIPKDNNVYIGNIEVDWAQIYIIKKENTYLFQCYHREADKNGHYGRYISVDKETGTIRSDGCEGSKYSQWEIL